MPQIVQRRQIDLYRALLTSTDGSGVPVVKYLSTALSSHLADLEIVIIKRSLNQVVEMQPAR